MNGVTCNGKTVSASVLRPGSEGSDCTDTVPESVCSLAEQSQDPNDFSNRYPLFIQVKNSSQAANKARIVKPVGRASNQGSTKQDATQDKQTVRPRRSASFSAPRKTATPSRTSQTSQPAQDTLRNGNLRREKSDIVRPRRTQSPANSTAIPSPARSISSSSLKQDNSVVSPRSQSPAGLRREHSDVTKRRASPSVRREKSDIVRPRGQVRTNSPTVSNEDIEGDIISRSSSNRSLTSSPLSKSPSKSSIEGSRSRSGSSTQMSKIPSLVRSPASAEKTDSHVSRIPSLPKKNSTEERTPPRSKIPSAAKVEKGQDVAKKSQIPTVGRKDSASQRDKAASKIPSSTALSQNRPDSAKENKDPTAASVPNGHEPVKHVSKIPSFSKSGIPKSKIPSVTRKDSQSEEQPTQNGEGEAHSPAIRKQSDTTKSKIPNASSSPQGTGIPVGVSRIPSFTKSPSTPPAAKTPESKLPTLGGAKPSEPDGPPANVSRIPTFPSTPPNKTPESKVPVPGGSRIPEPKIAAKSSPSSLPVASKPSGIPQASRIPGYAGENSTRKISSTEKEPVATGIPVASSPVETKSKLPSLPRPTAIPKPNGSEQAASKPRTGIPTLGGKRPSTDQENHTPEEPATPPSTPIRDNFASESPLDKYIFSEAKKMEQILRDEPIEVTVPAKEFEDDEEFLRQEKEILEQEEKEHEKELRMLDSKEAEDLICEVLKSYAPDINKENQPELDDSVNLYTLKETLKDDNKNIKEKVNIDDIVLKPAKSENEQPSKLDVKDDKAEPAVSDLKVDSKEVKEDGVEESKEIVEEGKPSSVSKSKNNAPDLKIAIPTKKVVENEPEEKGEKEATKSEGPAIDTLGEYAQQARRSRSRQRKIVSPDSEEPEKEFVAEPEKEHEKQVPKESENVASKEQAKKDFKKDKYGTAPFESEKKPKEASKSAKSKSKSDKPKFVIESSLGKDFYATRKSNESMESRDSVHDDAVKSSFKPELSALVFENKIVEKPFTLKQTGTLSTEEAVSLEEAEFEDIDLRSEQGMKNERREISRSVDTLDEKTVKCMGCGRGGKCSIM